MSASRSEKTVYLETFGCQMNELDSELVAGSLRALGYRFVAEPNNAKVVLYNTCSVREHAEQKVWSRLGELAIRKKDEPDLVVGVLGCMAERDGTALLKRMPQVDLLCGPGELDKLPSLVASAITTRAGLAQMAREALALERADELINHDKVRLVSANQVALQGSASRRSSTLAAAEDSLELLDLSRAISPLDADPDKPRASAYVRITRGCNKFCTYCVVPFTRGAEIHRPPEHIIDECKRLADAGVIEITLLGQTVNHYRFEHGAAITLNGVTQPQKGRSFTGGHRRDPLAGSNVTTFADLLRRIHDEVPSIQRLRFVTSYPRDFGDDVLEVIRDHHRLCRYIHVPAQSGSDRMLKLMNRGYCVSEYLEFLDRCRTFLDEPAKGRPLMLSGDFIVGFPTETEEDFQATRDLLIKARYKNAFIFKYSPRPGTIAFDRFEDDVSDELKRRRNNELLALQNTISDEISREQIGRTFDVMVEGFSRRTLRKMGLSGGQMRQAGTIAITIGGRNIDSAAGNAAVADTPDSACSTHNHDHATSCNTSTIAPPETLDESDDATVQLSCRTDGDQIVMIDVPARRAASLVGTIIPARITAAHALSLQAEMV